METRITLRPGQNGNRKLVERFGKRLIRVRYRYDEERRKRYTTVELIVSEADWTPRARKPRATRPPDEMVFVRVAFGEESLRQAQSARRLLAPALQALGASWGAVRALEIEDRVVQP